MPKSKTQLQQEKTLLDGVKKLVEEFNKQNTTSYTSFKTLWAALRIADLLAPCHSLIPTLYATILKHTLSPIVTLYALYTLFFSCTPSSGGKIRLTPGLYKQLHVTYVQCAENRIWEPVYCFNKLKEKHAIWIVPVIPGLANLKTREEVVQEIEVEYTAQDKNLDELPQNISSQLKDYNTLKRSIPATVLYESSTVDPVRVNELYNGGPYIGKWTSLLGEVKRRKRRWNVLVEDNRHPPASRQRLSSVVRSRTSADSTIERESSTTIREIHAVGQELPAPHIENATEEESLQPSAELPISVQQAEISAELPISVQHAETISEGQPSTHPTGTFKTPEILQPLVIKSVHYAGIPVYRLEYRTGALLRRQADSWISITQMLNIMQCTRKFKETMLKELKKYQSEKVTAGSRWLLGTWVPLDYAMTLAYSLGVYSAFEPLFTLQPTPEMITPIPTDISVQETPMAPGASEDEDEVPLHVRRTRLRQRSQANP